MDKALLFIAALIGGWLLMAALMRRFASRIGSDLVRDPLNVPVQNAQLNPESKFLVRFDDLEIVCERPDGKTETVTWNDLESVEVMTTSDGPLAPDCFWVLKGAVGGCVIPQGATGDASLLNRLQALPGFDNQQFIEAMGSTSENRFVCWKRGV